MTQSEFYRTLSRVTGESVRNLRRHGFSPVELDIQQIDSESVDIPPRTVDWDEVDAERMALAIQA